jgi:cysteine desulfurase / selenocysteine lyase
VASDYRREFFDFDGVAYLNTANQGALPRVSVKAMQTATEWKKLPHLLDDNLYFDLPDRVREKFARIIGAQPEEVALTTGASTGICAVAAGLNLQPGDEVIVAKGEFPAHFATWLPYEKAGLVRVNTISPEGKFIRADDYIQQIGPRTRLVSASLVRFDNGARLDAARVAEKCHAAGAALLLDLSQAAGVVPLMIRELGADFAVSSGYKWLLGPYGTGFFWVARERWDRLSLGPVYWMAIEGARKFHTLPLEGLQLTPGARRWDTAETGSFMYLKALETSLDLLLQIGLGEVERHNQELLREVIERIPRDRYGLMSPAEESKRGPYLCVAARKAEDTPGIYQRLKQEGVIVSLRENAIRIAPYLHNTYEDVNKLLKVLSVA